MGTELKLDSQLEASLKRVEVLVGRLQDPVKGVPITTVKGMWNTIPNVCTGQEIVSWLVKDLRITSRVEALNVARTIAKFGYIFVASDSKLTIKDDLTHHRFQDSFFWPTKPTVISITNYSIHLCKRVLLNKNRANLEVYEMDQFTRLQRHLAHLWENIWAQAEMSSKKDKKKTKAEQCIIESQERAFWNLHKPPPYSDYVLATDPLKFKKETIESTPLRPKSPPPKPSSPHLKPAKPPKRHSCSSVKDGLILNVKIEPPKAIECLIAYCKQYRKFDPLLHQTDSNLSWYTDESYPDSNQRHILAQRQVEKWSISLEELLRDPEGVVLFLKHLEKEHSSENLRFWLACEEYKACPLKRLKEKADLIYKEYLSRAALYQVNLYSKLMMDVNEGIKNPHHFTFQAAQNEIFRLMRSDSYPRFLKSENFVTFSKETQPSTHKGHEKKGLLSILTSPQHKSP